MNYSVFANLPVDLVEINYIIRKRIKQSFE
ncbi:hypothetical protein SAMN05443144_10292 [Fodinibius roseus]|uniref:Uncharacterized protein n=1 Tax=Fodinibius roseus TaxID=1194090 RepID=A0A1M4UPA4_9BACT|nr:hypothetical protein SAMN05443144_10292 [Fodinibius roseus]